MTPGTGDITATMACMTPGCTAMAGDTTDGVMAGDGLIMEDTMDGMILYIMVPASHIVAPAAHATMEMWPLVQAVAREAYSAAPETAAPLATVTAEITPQALHALALAMAQDMRVAGS